MAARPAKPRRRPLVAGNWKMHLTHLEAIALVQKIAFSLKETELEAVEVVVLPPFTSVRSVQTLIDADKIPFLSYEASGVLASLGRIRELLQAGGGAAPPGPSPPPATAR